MPATPDDIISEGDAEPKVTHNQMPTQVNKQ